MPGEGLQIPVDFTLDEARAALKQLEAAARTAGQNIQTGMKPATEGVGSFGSMLKQVARDQRGEGRIAAFYVSEMTAILPITGMAKMAIGELAQAFVGGAGLGAAIGLAVGSLKILSEWYRTATEAERKFGEGVIQRAPQIVEAYKQMQIEAGRFQAQLLGGAAGAARFNAELRNRTAIEGVEKTRDELHQTFAALDTIEKKVTLLKNQGRFNPIGQDATRLKEATAAYDAARQAYRAALGTKGEASNLGALELQAQLPQQGPQPATDSEFQAALNAQTAARKAALDQQYQDGMSALQALNQANEEEIKSSNAMAMELLEAEGKAEAAAKQYELDLAQAAEEGKYIAAQDSYEKRKALLDKEVAEMKGREATDRARLEQWAAAADAAATAIGQAFAAAATGQISLGKAMIQAAQGALAPFIAAVRKEIWANAIASAMAAYRSQASIPWVGPLLGAAAAATALSFGEGLLGRLGSAANGAVLPTSGGPFPFLLHPNEWVLPAEKSRGLNQLIEGGGGGSSRTVNVSLAISAIDGPSVRRLVRSSDFRKAIADATRDGRN